MATFKSVSNRAGVFKELIGFLWQRKLWWMIPMISLLIIVGLILIFAQSSAVAPFIYSLF